MVFVQLRFCCGKLKVGLRELMGFVVEVTGALVERNLGFRVEGSCLECNWSLNRV